MVPRLIRAARRSAAAVFMVVSVACSRHELRKACTLRASNGGPVIVSTVPATAGILVVRLTHSDTLHVPTGSQLRVRKLGVNEKWIAVAQSSGSGNYHVAVDPTARYELRASAIGSRPRHDTLPALANALSLLLPLQNAPLDGCDEMMTYRERKSWWKFW